MPERNRPARRDRDGNRSPSDVHLWAMLRSADDWPLAKDFLQISGGKPGSVAVQPSGLGVIDPRCPPLEGCMSQSRRCPSRASRCLGRTVLWGTQWGQLDGLARPAHP
jgi:hypothetical protein